MSNRKGSTDEAMIETDLTRAVERLGWVREDDVQPKDKGASWPYFIHGPWRLLIGTMGWATCYSKMSDGMISEIKSRRTDSIHDVVELVRSRT